MNDLIKKKNNKGLCYKHHSTAIIDENTDIGENTVIWHFSHVMKNARIGSNTILGQNCFVGNKAVIGDNVKIQNNVSIYDNVIIENNVFCGPSSVFTNVINPRSFIERKNEYKTTIVKQGASIGANATIVCGVTLGKYCFIGAGAVVTKDVPDYALIYGVPAVIKGWICECGEKLDKEYKCNRCNKIYGKEGNKLKEIL